MLNKKKILFLSSQFPCAAEPHSAPFNRQQAKYLSKLCDLVVVAPIFWFPFKRYRHNQKDIKDVFESTKLDDLPVYHPRVLYIPKILRILYGFLYFICVYPVCSKLNKTFQFDAIYVTWAYPDAFAALLLSKCFKKPFFVKVHGSDINVSFRYYLRKKIILYVLRKSEKVFVVSKALQKIITDSGIEKEKVTVLYNGIDRNIFRPFPQAEARKELGISVDDKMILYAGHLLKTKGIEYLIDAFQEFKCIGYKLAILGGGQDKDYFAGKIKNSGMENRINVVDECPHEQVPLWINASDLLCLPSLREGLPNVILEALACGKPIVATDVGGIREIFKDRKIPGKLVPPGNAAALSSAISEVLLDKWDHEDIISFTNEFSWENNAEKLYAMISISL